MSKKPKPDKAAQVQPEPGKVMAENGRGGPSIRRIEPSHELVFQRFVGRLEMLVPLETRAQKPVARPARPKGQRP